MKPWGHERNYSGTQIMWTPCGTRKRPVCRVVHSKNTGMLYETSRWLCRLTPNTFNIQHSVIQYCSITVIPKLKSSQGQHTTLILSTDTSQHVISLYCPLCTSLPATAVHLPQCREVHTCWGSPMGSFLPAGFSFSTVALLPPSIGTSSNWQNGEPALFGVAMVTLSPWSWCKKSTTLQ